MMMHVTTLFATVRRWGSVDRIRISPREGRVLRLVEGSLVTIADRDFEIVTRSVRIAMDHPLVEYECRGAKGTGRLHVQLDSALRTVSVSWSDAQGARELSEDDVQVWR